MVTKFMIFFLWIFFIGKHLMERLVGKYDRNCWHNYLRWSCNRKCSLVLRLPLSYPLCWFYWPVFSVVLRVLGCFYCMLFCFAGLGNVLLSWVVLAAFAIFSIVLVLLTCLLCCAAGAYIPLFDDLWPTVMYLRRSRNTRRSTDGQDGNDRWFSLYVIYNCWHEYFWQFLKNRKTLCGHVFRTFGHNILCTFLWFYRDLLYIVNLSKNVT